MSIHIKPTHKGRFHRAVNVPLGQPIPESKIKKAEHSKSPALRREANFADVAKNKFHHKGGKVAKDGYDNGGARGVAAGSPKGSGKAAPDGKNETKNGQTHKVDGMKNSGHPYPKHGKVHGVGVLPHDGMAKEFTPRTGKGSPHPGEEHLPHVHTSKHH